MKARPMGPATLLLAMITGCSSVGPNYHRPATPQPSAYTAHDPQSLPAAVAMPAQQLVQGQRLEEAWWQMFKSPAINAIVQQAWRNNPGLKAASYSLAEAQERVAVSKAARQPQVDMTADVGRSRYGAEFLGPMVKPPPFTYFSLGPTVSYALDYTGGLARSVEQQQAWVEFQHQQLKAAHLAVTGEAVILAIKVAALQAQIAGVKTLLQDDQERLNLVQSALAAGSMTQLDKLQADQLRIHDSSRLPALQEALGQSQDALAILLGQVPSQASWPKIEWAVLALPAQVPLGLPSELAHHRPDILAAEAQLHAATAAVGVATSRLYPQITLQANFSQQSTTPSQIFSSASEAWGLAGGLVAPIFDGGRLRRERQAAIDAMQALASHYQQTVLTAFAQVADNLQNLQHDAEAAEIQDHAQGVASQTLSLQEQRQKNGATDRLNVLEARYQVHQLDVQTLQWQSQRLQDTVQLFLALGGNADLNPHP